MAFKASHFTRDKDGAPSPIYPPLTADADKGDQDPILWLFNETGHERWREEQVFGTLSAHEAKEAHTLLVAGALNARSTGGRGYSVDEATAGQLIPVGDSMVRRITALEAERLDPVISRCEVRV